MNKQGVLAIAVGIAVAFGVAPSSFAGTVAGFGGATEITQLVNETLLTSQYGQDVLTAERALESVQALKQQLKQLDPSTLAGLSSSSLEQIQQLSSLDASLKSNYSASQAALGVMNQSIAQIRAQNITPDQYLQQRADLAATQGGQYAAEMQADQQKLADLQKQIADLRSASAAAGGVTSNIQGFQEMLQSGTRTQAQLVSLNNSVTHANLLAAQRAQTAAADKQAEIASQQATGTAGNNDAKRVINSKFTVPPVSAYTNPDPSSGH